jgi:hypothetical protein
VNILQENKTVNDDIIRICNVNVRTETIFRNFSSSQPLMERWAIDKTNASCHTSHGLNSCGISNLSRICIRVFLRRSEVSQHDLDHLVEGYYSSP